MKYCVKFNCLHLTLKVILEFFLGKNNNILEELAQNPMAMQCTKEEKVGIL